MRPIGEGSKLGQRLKRDAFCVFLFLREACDAFLRDAVCVMPFCVMAIAQLLFCRIGLLPFSFGLMHTQFLGNLMSIPEC